VAELLERLPGGGALCHCDFHPNNVIMSSRGLIAIDWAVGSRGNPLADLARSWLISRLWLSVFSEGRSGRTRSMWSTFWATYLCRYAELRPWAEDELTNWQIVMTAASLCWDEGVNKVPEATSLRLEFIQAALRGEAHPWRN
jgi:aminoglycoside phosphotransferase (APT) family kinase protein